MGRTLLNLLELADNLRDAQFAHIHNPSEETARALRNATHSYASARSGFRLFRTFAGVRNAVLARISGLNIERPVSPQEVMIAEKAIEFTYELLMGEVVDERGSD